MTIEFDTVATNNCLWLCNSQEADFPGHPEGGAVLSGPDSLSIGIRNRRSEVRLILTDDPHFTCADVTIFDGVVASTTDQMLLVDLHKELAIRIGNNNAKRIKVWISENDDPEVVTISIS